MITVYRIPISKDDFRQQQPAYIALNAKLLVIRK
jgi:hypothetical protein